MLIICYTYCRRQRGHGSRVGQSDDLESEIDERCGWRAYLFDVNIRQDVASGSGVLDYWMCLLTDFAVRLLEPFLVCPQPSLLRIVGNLPLTISTSWQNEAYWLLPRLCDKTGDSGFGKRILQSRCRSWSVLTGGGFSLEIYVLENLFGSQPLIEFKNIYALGVVATIMSLAQHP